MSRGSLRALPAKLTPIGARLGVESGRERRRRRVRSTARTDDYGRITGLRRNRRAAGAGNRIASKPLGLHHLVDAVRSAEAGCLSRGRRRSARDRRSTSISSETSSLRLAVADRARPSGARRSIAISSAERLHRRRRPEAISARR